MTNREIVEVVKDLAAKGYTREEVEVLLRGVYGDGVETKANDMDLILSAWGCV